MKILLSMPNDGQSNNYIINALQDLQFDVYFVDHRNFLEECRKTVPEILKREKPDYMMVLYLADKHTYTRDDLRSFKMCSPNTKFISWIFDVVINGELACENEKFLDLMKEYDYFFTVAKGHVEQFRSKGINAHWGQEGCCPYSHMPIESFSADGHKIQNLDITFIGQIGQKQFHADRIALLEQIVKKYNKVRIYGHIYDISQSLIPYHMGRPTFNDIEHNKIVNRTKINIGNSGWTDIDGYMSARNYRICAASGFLLANHSKSINEFYSQDEIGTYENISDCLSRIEYYLENDEVRNQMRLKAYDRTINNYTFTNSLEKMFKVIKEN